MNHLTAGSVKRRNSAKTNPWGESFRSKICSLFKFEESGFYLEPLVNLQKPNLVASMRYFPEKNLEVAK